jgi:hypothetical protein
MKQHLYCAAEKLTARLAEQKITAHVSPALTLYSRVSRIPGGLELIEYDLCAYWQAETCRIYPIEPRHLITLVQFPKAIPWPALF